MSESTEEVDSSAEGKQPVRGWAEAREVIEQEHTLHIKKWYFPVLIVMAGVLLMISLVTGSLWAAAAAVILSIALARWNEKVGEGRGEKQDS